MNKLIVMKIVPPISSSLKRSLLYRLVMASILGKLISPKPAAFGSLLLGSWAYGADGQKLGRITMELRSDVVPK